jgi:hypothetical protein
MDGSSPAKKSIRSSSQTLCPRTSIVSPPSQAKNHRFHRALVDRQRQDFVCDGDARDQNFRGRTLKEGECICASTVHFTLQPLNASTTVLRYHLNQAVFVGGVVAIFNLSSSDDAYLNGFFPCYENHTSTVPFYIKNEDFDCNKHYNKRCACPLLEGDSDIAGTGVGAQRIFDYPHLRRCPFFSGSSSLM